MKPFWLVSALCSALAVNGATITGAKAGGDPVRQAPYTVSLTPRPVTHIAASDLYTDPFYGDLNLLRGKFNDTTEWLFSSAGSDAPGTFNVLQYDPWIAQNLGGANFNVLYDDSFTATQTNYDWVQIAHFHNWGSKGSGDAVDAHFSNFPFYGTFTPDDLSKLKTSDFPSVIGSGDIWLNKKDYPVQKIQNPKGEGKVPAGDLLFTDQPYCSLGCADLDGKAYAYFDLFLTTYTWNGKLGNKAGGTVSLMDGMRWGVEITKDPTTFDDPGKIPEPATYALIGAGLVFIWIARKRRGQL